MIALSEHATVGQIVAERAGRARVFEGFGIDYCCGGKRPLGEACSEHGLDAKVVIDAIRTADAEAAPTQEEDWSRVPTNELIEHIVGMHHAFLRRELPRLGELAMKTEEAHGERHGELAECRSVLAALHAELESHMLKEEQILFPALRNMESASPGREGFFGSLQGPIGVMEHEHESAAEALSRLRELTNDFTPPEDACNTWRALLDGLRTLETDLHQHIHKENNILFPRAIGLETGHAHTAPSAKT